MVKFLGSLVWRQVLDSMICVGIFQLDILILWFNIYKDYIQENILFSIQQATKCKDESKSILEKYA